MSPLEIFFIVLQLIFLEGILSIDNAAVLGSMVSELPSNEPIPWPKRLSFLQGWGDRVLGAQRGAALKVGLLGAYLGRALMLLVANFVIRNAWLRILGAFYLFKLAISHLGIDPRAKQEKQETVYASTEEQQAAGARHFWQVVLMVELADLAFSVDNVVAAVALSDRLWVVLVGVALGIVTMRFAAQVFTVMIEREPILAPTAYVLILNIGLELMIEEFATAAGFHLHFAHWQKFLISIATIAFALIYAHWPWLHRTVHPLITFIRRILGYINFGIDLVLRPFSWIIKQLYSLLRSLFQSVSSARARS